MSSTIKTFGFILVLTLLCGAQESEETCFIQARAYDMNGHDSLALQSYEKAYAMDPTSKFLKKEVLIRYIRRGLYDRVLDIVKTSTDKIQLWDLNCYRNGDAVAKFYLYCDDTAQASELWQGLIINAVANDHLDSALILSDSFVKNMPLYSLPHRIQSKLLAGYKKIIHSPNEDRN
jgi:hypothetical protein